MCVCVSQQNLLICMLTKKLKYIKVKSQDSYASVKFH